MSSIGLSDAYLHIPSTQSHPEHPLVVVNQFTPTPKFIQNHHNYTIKLPMYMINLIIIYDVANIFSMKMYKSLRKLRVGVNRYMGVNWSTTTISPEQTDDPVHSLSVMYVMLCL